MGGANLKRRKQGNTLGASGFAHAFLVLSESAEFVYKCTDYYTPGDEYSIRWDDPTLAVKWPGEVLPPVLSEKDTVAPLLRDAKLFD